MQPHSTAPAAVAAAVAAAAAYSGALTLGTVGSAGAHRSHEHYGINPSIHELAATPHAHKNTKKKNTNTQAHTRQNPAVNNMTRFRLQHPAPPAYARTCL